MPFIIRKENTHLSLVNQKGYYDSYVAHDHMKLNYGKQVFHRNWHLNVSSIYDNLSSRRNSQNANIFYYLLKIFFRSLTRLVSEMITCLQSQNLLRDRKIRKLCFVFVQHLKLFLLDNLDLFLELCSIIKNIFQKLKKNEECEYFKRISHIIKQDSYLLFSGHVFCSAYFSTH